MARIARLLITGVQTKERAVNYWVITIGTGLKRYMWAVLGVAVLVSAQQPTAAAAPGPVPPALQAAHNLFISNAGADSGLFPSPFSGDPDRPYDQFYAALKATGQFNLVADPSDADLVLELRLSAPNGPVKNAKQYGSADPLPMFRLVVFDRKTHYILWAVTESVEIAYLQKTHDTNFDRALNRVVGDFLQVAGRAAPSAKP